MAIAGEFAWPPLLMGAAVLCWVAGFDILYACQDYEFDRETGLHSIPVRFGMAASLRLARLFHLAAVGCMLAVGYMMGLQIVFYLGVALIADGMHFHIPRGYLYFAIFFSGLVEVLNLLARKNRQNRRAKKAEKAKAESS